MKIFGEYEKQNQDIESLEKDLFLRKIINILTITEKLKKNKIDTYICIDKEYKKILFEFSKKHLENLCKRIFYNYFLRDMTVASLELLGGIILIFFGIVFGGVHWLQSITTGVATPVGTVMLAALPSLIGLQL